jgi:hypothetical protein
MQASQVHPDFLNSKTGKHRATRNTVNIRPNSGRLRGCASLHFVCQLRSALSARKKGDEYIVGVFLSNPIRDD